RLGRRHDLVRPLRTDPLDERAGVRLAGNDDLGLEGIVATVEAQAGLARGAIRAMTGEAVLRQDRPHGAVVIDLAVVAGACRCAECQEDGTGPQSALDERLHFRKLLLEPFLLGCGKPLPLPLPLDEGMARDQYLTPERMCRAMARLASLTS